MTGIAEGRILDPATQVWQALAGRACAGAFAGESAQRTAVMPYLIVEFRGGRVQRIALRKSPMIFGRGARCDLQIVDPKISREHCQLSEHEGQWYLEDLDSRNHTWMGFEPIKQVVLSDGDQFRIGGTHFTFRTEADPAEVSEEPRDRS